MAPGVAGAAVLHPLLHSNTSDLREQSYSVTFSGEEYFLQDHEVEGQRVLPAGVYLEMARVAVEKAARRSAGGGWEMREVVWGPPLVVQESQQVNIVLLAQGEEEIEYEIYSRKGEEEIIHCQGRAAWSEAEAPGKLDVEQWKRNTGQERMEPGSIYRASARKGLGYGPSMQAITGMERRKGKGEGWAQLRVPGGVADRAGDYVLHPSLLEGALQAALVLSDEVLRDGGGEWNEVRLPVGLDRLRIVSPCRGEMLAWVRNAPASRSDDKVTKVDIDLCNEQGSICAQMRGVRWRPVSLCMAEPVVEKAAPALAASAPNKITRIPLVPREIVFLALPSAMPAQVRQEKPRRIALTALTDAAEITSGDKRRAPITLATPTVSAPLPGSAAAAVSMVRLYDEGEGVFAIHIAAGEGSDLSSADRMAQLLQALARVQEERSTKVLKLRGLEGCFRRGGREDYNQAVEQKVYEAVVTFPYPVIAIVREDAIGAGLLAAALCDLMVCSEEARYGYSDRVSHYYATGAEAKVVEERFGSVLAQDLLYGSGTATGKEQRRKGWTCPMLPGEQIEGQAQELAWKLATKSQNALRLLKQHLTRDLVALVKELKQVEAEAEVTVPEMPAKEQSSATRAEEHAFSAKHIRVETPIENVVLVKLAGRDRQTEAKELLTELGQILEKIRNSDCKAMVLASEAGEFIPPELGHGEEVVEDFQRHLMELEIPVVAALTGNAKGAAWLISQLCDACVYSRTGLYSAAEMGRSRGVGATAAATFIYRLGKAAGQEILLTGAEYRGEDLERRVGTLLVAEQGQVLAKAVEVAEGWARQPRAGLTEWKKHRGARLQELQEKMRRVSTVSEGEKGEGEAGEVLVTGPTAIALRSRVVTATAHPEGIVVVKMEDRKAKNMFSDALLEGVREVCTHIEQTPRYKVVILTGYDSYFSCGGTKESLLAIQAGKAKFTDYKIFQVPPDCKLPVIAAMQGHGIGAGWSLGMFADVVLLSEESRYESPYMNYGFTPGAGATWVLGEKLGQDLARESLLTGEQYAGSELKARGVKLAVLPRAEVNAAAMELARQIAGGSRRGLMDLKQRLMEYVRPLLEETYRLELGMHEKTFVGQTDTLAQIHKSFAPEIEASLTTAQLGQNEEPAASPTIDSDLLSTVTGTIKTFLADELHLQESDIDEDVEFVDLGLDSINGVTLLRKINEKYHTSIEATKVYSYPTLAQLSRYVKEEAEKRGTLSSEGAPAAAMPIAPSLPKGVTKLAGEKLTSWRRRKAARFSSTAPQVSHFAQPIAVIGMSGQFPQAKNLDEFWQNIAEGRNCITHIPPSRWDVKRYSNLDPNGSDKINYKWLGVLDDVDCFDPLFFRISPQEAEYIDPQHRLFLQESYKAFEDAGYCANTLGGKRCGVYLGISAHEYPLLLAQNGVLTMPITSNSNAIAAGRIAYYLNLKGPAISIDTACSSSLVAIHLGCQGLWNGETDMALAGGVTVWLNPATYVSMYQSGGMSPIGQCKTFDDSADGVVLSEGVGAVVLKRLKDAQAENDSIYGVILGSGLNQDGRTNGITAPSVISQAELERSVYEKYNIDPETITYVETHGAGSVLGDPIELEALATAFRGKTTRKNYCALGSVKTNIGHTAAAAGAASTIKALLSLRHRTLAPVLHVTKENSHFDFKNSPFYVCREKQAWDVAPGSLRRAAVSSFGYSGTNAHLVIEEYVPPGGQPAPFNSNTSFIVPLSARAPEQLRQKARDLLEFIRRPQHDHSIQESTLAAKPVDLASVAYTLQVGRESMEERLGFVVNSIDQLAEKLMAYLNGEKKIEGACRGRVESSSEGITMIGRDDDMQEAIEKWIARKKFSKLLDLWIRGLNFDWNKLYGAVKPQRISLPTYPFARQRCWVPEITSSPGANGNGHFEENVDLKSIERIINQIDDDMIETERAAKELRGISASLSRASTSQSPASPALLSRSKFPQDLF